MKIDFDELRIQACDAYDELIDQLNDAKNYEGYLMIDPNLITKSLDTLRTRIAMIAMCNGKNETVNNVFTDQLKKFKMPDE